MIILEVIEELEVLFLSTEELFECDGDKGRVGKGGSGCVFNVEFLLLLKLLVLLLLVIVAPELLLLLEMVEDMMDVSDFLFEGDDL